MELKQAPVYKNHGYRACISSAFSLFYDNIKNIVSHTWIYALAFSLLISICGILYPSPLCLYSMTLENPYIVIGLAGALLLFFVAQLVFHSSITSLLTCRPVKWNILRNFKVVASMLAIVGVISVVLIIATFFLVRNLAAPENLYVILLTVYVAYILLFFVFILPFAYGMMKYIMEPATKLKQVFTTFYVSGLKHWGLLFVVFMTVSFFIVIAKYAVMLPVLVLSYAAHVSETGVIEYGDVNGLPSYFSYMYFAVCLITSFISLYISTIIIFAALYVYGSVSVRDEIMNAKK